MEKTTILKSTIQNISRKILQIWQLVKYYYNRIAIDRNYNITVNKDQSIKNKYQAILFIIISKMIEFVYEPKYISTKQKDKE